MLNYIVIGICVILLLLVVYISAKPISMGIEARRNINEIKDTNFDSSDPSKDEVKNTNKIENISISDEIIKLNELKKKGLLTDEEYNKAKDKLFN
tara:strand:- start:423 stop:707 length:285 start_codon:yes stop_codon:yes gene_type:complete